MGWVWKNDDEAGYDFSSVGDHGELNGLSKPDGRGDGNHCATRKVVKSQCHTEEVEPGKFIRKCEKTEQVFKDCIGRPSEMVQSNKEYTEEDVTDEMVKGSFSLDVDPGHRFPGLRSDIEAIERDIFGGISRFFEAAEEMKNEFFNSVGVPKIFDHDSSSSHKNRGIPIESFPPKEDLPKNNSDGDVDLSGLAKDI
ncbi:hypothetical protein RD792_014320 [Penstemon davidsonii]|uniref:Mal d 1-associated protein n=1 Tax=Penstemon davidsonii TaxID=160366 RepID=A0ABR0CPJ5_9LAMI|nr:hypothetical protein RD792_014320 [Penstemon davidsonii]